MSRLVVLCGESPLPVWLSALTLAAEDVLIVHGELNSRTAAQSVGARLTEEGVKTTLFEVSPFNLVDLQTTIQEELIRAFIGRSFVFGPGTTLMNVLLYGAWLRANSSAPNETEAWWTEAGGGRLHSLTGALLKFDTSSLDLAMIARLHDTSVDIKSGPNVVELVKAFTDEDLKKLGDHVDLFLKREEQPKVEFSAKAQGLIQGFVGDDQSFKPGGLLLELATGIFITRYFQKIGRLPDEAALNLYKMIDNRRIVEFDFVARWGEKVLCVSCGKGNYGELRNKLFEVDSRSPKMFGRETRTLTVADAQGDMTRNPVIAHNPESSVSPLHTIWTNRREQLSASWERQPRDTIVAARELFGEDIATSFVNPEQAFTDETMPLATWLKRAAGLL